MVSHYFYQFQYYLFPFNLDLYYGIVLQIAIWIELPKNLSKIRITQFICLVGSFVTWIDWIEWDFFDFF